MKNGARSIIPKGGARRNLCRRVKTIAMSDSEMKIEFLELECVEGASKDKGTAED